MHDTSCEVGKKEQVDDESASHHSDELIVNQSKADEAKTLGDSKNVQTSKQETTLNRNEKNEFQDTMISRKYQQYFNSDFLEIRQQNANAARLHNLASSRTDFVPLQLLFQTSPKLQASTLHSSLVEKQLREVPMSKKQKELNFATPRETRSKLGPITRPTQAASTGYDAEPFLPIKTTSGKFFAPGNKGGTGLSGLPNLDERPTFPPALRVESRHQSEGIATRTGAISLAPASRGQTIDGMKTTTPPTNAPKSFLLDDRDLAARRTVNVASRGNDVFAKLFAYSSGNQMLAFRRDLKSIEEEMKKAGLGVSPRRLDPMTLASVGFESGDKMTKSQRLGTSHANSSTDLMGSLHTPRLALHTSQNHLMKQPTLRQEVALLSDWFDSMIKEQAVQTDQSLPDLFQNMQTIYIACLQELIRQISSECSERAQLLQKIWDSFLQLIEKTLFNTAKEETKRETEHLRKIRKLYKDFEDEQGKHKLELEHVKEQLGERDKQIEELMASVQYWKRTGNRLEVDLALQRERFVGLRAEFDKVNNEKMLLQMNRATPDQFEKNVIPQHRNSLMAMTYRGGASPSHNTQANQRRISELEEQDSPMARGSDMKNNSLGSFMGIAHKGTSTAGLVKLVETEMQTLIVPPKDVEIDVQIWETFDKVTQTEMENAEQSLGSGNDNDRSAPRSPEDEEHSPIGAEEEEDDEVRENVPNAVIRKPKQTGRALVQEVEEILQMNDVPEATCDELLTNLCNNIGIITGTALSLDIPPNTPDIPTPRELGGSLILDAPLEQLPELPSELPEKKIIFEFLTDTGENLIQEYLDRASPLDGDFQRTVRELSDPDGALMGLPAQVKRFILLLLAREIKRKAMESELLTRVKRKLHEAGREIESLKEEITEKRVDVEDLERQAHSLRNERDELIKILNYNEHQVQQLVSRAEKNKEILSEKYELTKQKNTKMMSLLKQVSQKLLLGAIQEQPPENEMASPVMSSDPNARNRVFSLDSIIAAPQRALVPKIVVTSREDAAGGVGDKGVMAELKEYLVAEDSAREKNEASDYSSDADDHLHAATVRPPRRMSTSPNVDISINQRSPNLHSSSTLRTNSLVPSVALPKAKLAKPAVSGNIDQATMFVQSYKRRVTNKAIPTRASIPLINITKVISTVYTDRLKQMRGGAGSMTTSGASMTNQPLYLMLFEMFLHRFGLRKVAESKLNVLLDAARFYAGRSRRLRMFCRFLGLLEPTYDNEDFSMYIDCHRLFDEGYVGAPYISSQNDVVLVPLQRVHEVLSLKFASRLGVNEMTALYQDIESQRKPEVELDYILEQILRLNATKRTEVKNHVKRVFLAADLDRDDLIEFPEFLTIFRFIEPEKFREDTVRDMFFAECDMISPETGEKVLSLQRFATICLREGLFTEAKQAEYIKRVSIQTSADHVKTYEDLISRWIKRKEEIKHRFLASRKFEVFFKKALNKIGECLDANANLSEEKREINWMSYRLIESEANRVFLEYHSTRILGNEFQFILEKSKECIDDMATVS